MQGLDQETSVKIAKKSIIREKIKKIECDQTKYEGEKQTED